ncbi:hypothetical protein KI387_041951, partial [Taxus chinensis]
MSTECIVIDKNLHSGGGRIIFSHQQGFQKALFEEEADRMMVEEEVSESDEGGEDSEEVDALLNLEVQIPRVENSVSQNKFTESLERLREMVGGGDAVEVIEEAIGCVKKLHMELLAKLQGDQKISP